MIDKEGVVQVRVTPKTKNRFTIKALSISGVAWKRHVLNHALGRPAQEGGDRRTSGGRNILDQERFKLKKPQVGYPACFSTLALSQIEAKLLLAGI